MSPHEQDNSSEAEAAIAAAKLALPQLFCHGMRYPGCKIGCDNFALQGVSTALEFLKQCRKTQKPNRNSYGLKHAAERWGKTYIANGELIVAAVFLGFPYHWSGDGPNVLIGVSERDLKRLAS